MIDRCLGWPVYEPAQILLQHKKKKETNQNIKKGKKCGSVYFIFKGVDEYSKLRFIFDSLMSHALHSNIK